MESQQFPPAQDPLTTQAPVLPPTEPKSSNYTLILVIVCVVVAALVGAVLLLTRSQPAAKQSAKHVTNVKASTKPTEDIPTLSSSDLKLDETKNYGNRYADGLLPAAGMLVPGRYKIAAVVILKVAKSITTTHSAPVSRTLALKLSGYALDGFPITGPKLGDNNILTTSDLDECHGITSTIVLDGKNVISYHYVMTQDFPYSVSCFKATAIQPPKQPQSSQKDRLGPMGGIGQ